MRMERLLRADEATELGVATFLEQYARMLSARRRRGAFGPADAYYASQTLSSAAAILRVHLRKYALYAAAVRGSPQAGPDERDAARRLTRAARSLRAALPRASASLAELGAFHARKREALAGTSTSPPSPPWLHPDVGKHG